MLILIIIIALGTSFTSNGRKDETNSNSSNGEMLIPPSLSPSVAFPSTLQPAISLPSAVDLPAHTMTTSVPSVAGFKETAVIYGQGDGDRLGSSVSMTRDGNFMALFGSSSTSPVLTFHQRNKSHDDWFPVLASFPIGHASVSFGSAVDTATLPDSGYPIVAVSSTTQVGVYKLVNGRWIEFGKPVRWNSKSSVSYTAIALSSDATTLAAGYVNDAGDEMWVNVYTYDSKTMTWNAMGESSLLVNSFHNAANGGEKKGTVLSISLTLSGNGRVLTVEEWAVAQTQVVIQTFKWNGGKASNWSVMGNYLPIPFGPASVALSDNGHRVAVVTDKPGKGVVFEWDNTIDEWNALGNNLPGGSSVALASDGSRIIIGDSSIDKAFLYDYSKEASHTWSPVEVFAGSDSSSYGAVVVIDEIGETIGIGAPTTKSNGKYLGQVVLYGSEIESAAFERSQKVYTSQHSDRQTQKYN